MRLEGPNKAISAGVIGPPDERNKYTVVGMVGKGQFSKVYKAIKPDDDASVFAIKVLVGTSPQAQAAAKKEVVIHKQLQHAHIIKLEEDFVYDGHQCIVMPFIDGGTLRSEIPNGHCLSEIWARYFFQQLICSVLYLAQQGVYHQDLKLSNMLYEKATKLIFLSDFGLSERKDSASAPTSVVGTPLYMSPELHKIAASADNQHEMLAQCNRQKSEVWSCGVILFLLIYGKFPVECKDIINVTHVTIPQSRQIGDTSVQVSKECRDLLRKMLDINPGTRISLLELLSDPWYLQALPSGCQGWVGDVDW